MIYAICQKAISKFEKLNFSSWLLLLIGLLGGLRLIFSVWFNIDSLNQDEAAILLNAKFLAQSGMDEWGDAWPVLFRSFGDSKLPGYIYLTMMLGVLTNFGWWTVRIGSFLAGLANVWLVGQIGKNWWSSKVGLVSAILVASSPWTWHYSSIGFEANLGLMFWLLTLWLLTGESLNKLKIVGGVISFTLGILTYNSPLLLFPILLVAILLRWWPKHRRQSLIALLVFSSLFLLGLGLTWSATEQKQGITIFSDPTLLWQYPTYRAAFDSPLMQTLLGNKVVYFGGYLAKNVLNSWSWKFLVAQGGSNPWHNIPGQAHLTVVGYLLIPLGLWALFSQLKNNWRDKASWFLIFSLVWGLFPAVITVDAPHATRSLFFFISLTWLGALLAKNLTKKYYLGLIFLVFINWFVWWWPSLGVWHSEQVSHKWYPAMETYLEQSKAEESIYIQDKDGVLYPRVALWSGISAADFHQTAVRAKPDAAGLEPVRSFGKYFFVEQKPDDASGIYLWHSNGEWDIIKL